MQSIKRRMLAPRMAMLALILAVAGMTAAINQDPAAVSAQEGDPPVVALHRGDCGSPEAAPVADLGVLSPYGTGVGQDAAVMRGMQTDAQPVLSSAVTLDIPFDDVFSEQQLHSLAIHQNAASFGTLLACGEVAGAEVDGRVVIGLRPVNDSSYAGVAILDDDDAGFLGLGENQTAIATYLVGNVGAADAEATEATPEPAAAETEAPADEVDATPVADQNGAAEDEAAADQAAQDESATETVTVEAVDIDFNPSQFSIPANTDAPVLLVNNGAIEHTFTIDELDIDEALAPGEEREITINADAGDYVFYCTVPGHRPAGQEGTMTVE